MKSVDLSSLMTGAGRLAAAIGEHVLAKLRRSPRRPSFPRRCHWCDRQVHCRTAEDSLGHELPVCDTWSWLVMGRAPAPAVSEASPACTCTCGSGGHPRYCHKHPLAMAAHIAELNEENDADWAASGETPGGDP